MYEYIIELLEMADMYVSKCTRQEEKFDYYKRNGIPWIWDDCIAAYRLVRELPNNEELYYEWRKGKLDKPLMTELCLALLS